MASAKEKFQKALRIDYREQDKLWLTEQRSLRILMSYCYRRMERITDLAILRDYAAATRELIQLNTDVPEFGDYGEFNAPWYEKARRDYPPLQEALDKLKLKRSAELEQIIKF